MRFVFFAGVEMNTLCLDEKADVLSSRARRARRDEMMLLSVMVS